MRYVFQESQLIKGGKRIIGAKIKRKEKKGKKS